VTKRVGMGLRRLAQRGSILREGERKTARWRIT
jgi:hypothetical protein